MPRIDYTDRAGDYGRARTLPAAVLARWRAAVIEIRCPRSPVVLDLGPGPGGFLEPLQEWFAGSVIAIEPSAAMRQEATDRALAARYPYIAAWAEALPLGAASIDVAWLSTVIHQFDNRDQAAHELRRVIRPGGRVLLRGFLSDVPITSLFNMFPGIERSAASFPSTDAIISTFESAGFHLDSIVDVIEPWEFELAWWTERVRSIRHMDSLLRPLTDAEFDEGLRVISETFGGDDIGTIANNGTLRLITFET